MTYLKEFGTWIVGGVGSAYAFATGHIDVANLILLGVMAIDIASGILRGLQQKRLKSTIMSLGIIKKGGIILSIVFTYLLDMLINDGQPVFSTMMTWLAIGNESLSVMENLTALGVNVPSFIKDRLAIHVESAKDIQEIKDKK